VTERTLNALLVGTELSRSELRSVLSRAGFSLREQAELPVESDGSWLVCVALDHPDQYAGEEVRRFLAEFAGARVICVRFAWCASMLRSRSDWPAAVVVNVDAFERRLACEGLVLQGKRPPLPLTAGLEEIAAFDRVDVPKTPITRWGASALVLIAGLIFGGCSRESPKVDEAKPDPGWSEQVEAVRAGGRKTIRVRTPPPPAEWAMLAKGCGPLEVLEIEEGTPANTDLALLKTLAKLRRLKLGELTDEGAAAVGELSSISELLVSSAALTDQGVASLCRLPLVQLRLEAPGVTDASMEALAGLKQLRFLHLIDVPITDAALPALAGLESLESLYLDRAKCTDEGLSALLKERPDIHFHLDQTHLPDDPRKHAH